MATIVGIQFQKNGKTFNYDVNNLDVKPDDYVIADTSHGIDLGQVVIGCRHVDDNEPSIPLKKLIRIATEKDLQTSADNREKECEAFNVCQKKIAEHKLDMKLVSVEYAFDNSKALFYFTANGRVDFRSLVKDLASVFKMRIELRQIGVRDEARMIGGLGPCGRQICCGSFLEEFQPVSIKMAKEQNLSLNPTKISGVCGRLMCCLKYEQDHYEQTRKIMPRIGKEVKTPDGNGIVSDLNIVKETVFVRITNGDSSEIKEYPLEKVERVSGGDASASAERKENNPEAGEARKNAAASDVKPEAENGNRKDKNGSAKEMHRGKGAQNGSFGKVKMQQKPDKQESGRKNPALGKPVMRENPNRTAPKQEPAPSAAENRDEKTESAPSWAEAVRKAIDSIN